MHRNKKQEQKIISHRAKILITFCSILFFILFFRLVFLQLINNEKYQELKLDNITKTNYITPERGDIYDRNGILIAGNRSLFSLSVIPEKIDGFRKDKDKVGREFIEDISILINLEENEKENILKKLKKTPIFVEFIIKSDLTLNEISKIAENRKYQNAIYITSKKVRDYIDGKNYLNVLGYVGKVSSNDLKSSNRILTNLDYVGKIGIEKKYNDILLGQHGEEVVGLNAFGKTIVRKKIKEQVKGKNLTTTIDSKLQKLAYDLLGDEKGAIVAIDPNNGEVLALASTPTYDPNKLIKGISKEEYEKVFLNESESPFFNRAISGQYPPASTVKPFMSIAGLVGDWIDPNKNVWSGPYYQIKGSSRKFNDWKKSGHGWVNMTQSIEMSVDVYYYKLGQEMGIDYIHDVMSLFGFGKKTGIELKNEKTGLLPSTKWKKEVKKESWYTGETLIASIGQGFMLSTPIQLAQATSVLVNGGKVFKPKLIKDNENILIEELNIPKEYVDIAKKGMRDVIFGSKGTARQWKNKIVRYNQGGKTGTAQVYSTNGERPDDKIEIPKHLKDHAVYIGFAPFDNPKIVVSVVIENIGGGSTYAAPIGIEIMQNYLDRNYPEELLEGKEVLRGEDE